MSAIRADRSASLSAHCQREGAHGLHWVPAGMWSGGMTLEDLCAGTPKAFVKDERGDEHEVLSVTPHRFGPAFFGYACEIAGGYELYAMPEDIRIGFC